ncbi:MAG: PEP-CTERM sorting domain-containing protein [Fimbriimonadaceae bacterium]|nr:PEP-CTERM sorting domain-containing protein [Fimbriimonadaceae bacterium]
MFLSRLPRSLSSLALAVVGSIALAQPVPPQLSSNPGARYTIYLNFRGFNYNGTWGGRTPGNVPAYTIDGDPNTFNAEEVAAIRESWARTAQAYTGFNVNVTTVDPAPSNFTDAQRKTFYDNTQYLTHTIIGGSNSWYGNAGGVSYVAIAQQATTTGGRRTNWVFPVNTGTSPKRAMAAAIHEVGHHLRLLHQSDETSGAAYSNNNGATGNGSYAPIMGTSYVSQRGTWRMGKAGVNDNDVFELQQNLNIGSLLDSGVGHTLATATSMPLNGDGTINATQAKGWIMPTAASGYNANNYTTDYFRFTSIGGSFSLTAHDGTQFLEPGVADPGATGRATLKILDSNGNLVGSATEDASTLVRTWSGSLAAGTYYAQVSSYGAYISSYEPDSRYFNMGGYFLSGTGFAVPEPASMLALLGGLAVLVRRRRRAN